MGDFFRNYLRYPLESLAAHLYVMGLKMVSIDRASTIGKWVGQQIGGRTGRTKIARQALQKHVPGMSPAEQDQILAAMWSNLGRVTMEYARLQDVLGELDQRIEIIGAENLAKFKSAGAGMIFSAHFGNWEMVTLALRQAEIGPLNVVYREANNKALNELIRSLQGDGGAKLIAKGASGARDILKALKNQEKIVMLVDQKMNDGIAVPFFGQPVMTAPALAQLSLKFNCPILPMRAVRQGPVDHWTTRFKIIIEPPILPDQYRHRDLQTSDHISLMMYDVNQILERWIRADPGQWLWIHNRWPKAHQQADVTALWEKQKQRIEKYLPNDL